MAKVSAGEKKKKLILDTCKALFYEKGYLETTFAEIADRADIPQGSITYHFGGKLGIGLAIRAEFERKDYEYTHALLSGHCVDFKTRTVIGFLHYWKLLFEDANLRRFLMDITTGGFANAEKIDETKRYYLPIMNECGIDNVDERRLNLIAASHVGIELELLSVLERNLDAYTYEEIALFFIERRFELIGVPREIYQDAIRIGRTIFPLIPYDNDFYANFRFDEKYMEPVKIDFSL